MMPVASLGAPDGSDAITREQTYITVTLGAFIALVFVVIIGAFRSLLGI